LEVICPDFLVRYPSHIGASMAQGLRTREVDTWELEEALKAKSLEVFELERILCAMRDSTTERSEGILKQLRRGVLIASLLQVTH
jgi:hypothetical protein